MGIRSHLSGAYQGNMISVPAQAKVKTDLIVCNKVIALDAASNEDCTSHIQQIELGAVQSMMTTTGLLVDIFEILDIFSQQG
jgi:hypothetical protein